MEAQDRLVSCLLFGMSFIFFIVTPQKFTISLEYVENEERLIAAKSSNAYNIVSPVWGQYSSNLGSL